MKQELGGRRGEEGEGVRVCVLGRCGGVEASHANTDHDHHVGRI